MYKGFCFTKYFTYGGFPRLLMEKHNYSEKNYIDLITKAY